ncbi:NrsF family protein [Bradyrhizobium sp. NP1]|jgi:hypothetical protein|uniref:NrsF family protein n=1 Tax=Bradyrhizobium sp. NP1 TaxID=3049772 RepID=UPI0025A60C67|nr:NrsF family protein [Bradyrhizobium sp. NP1]WJR81269.1 NrsF family protein [Bradyrhizobium sp. NP1]
MKTSELIDRLADTAAPVRPLRPPLVRAALWLSVAAAVLALLAVGHGVRPDLPARLHQGVFVVSLGAALVTGILAAIAAFNLGQPESSRWWCLLPVPALAAWVSTIGYGCLTDWVDIGPDGVRMGEAVRCFSTLLLTSLPLSVAMLVMLRHVAVLRPTIVSMTGGLAIAAMTAFALSLIHDLDATIMIIVWQLGTAVAIAGLAGILGRSSFAWAATRISPGVPASLTQ